MAAAVTSRSIKLTSQRANVTTPSGSRVAGKLCNAVLIGAVLPFQNPSADPENEYFSDGLAEEILNALSRIEGLHVAARTSSFSFRGRTTDVAEIGARLRVATVSTCWH